MGEVVHAESRFLASKEAHILAMDTEKRLRDLAAKAANFYASGLPALSNEIILEIVPDEKKAFREYLQEYLRYYESE